MAITKAQVIQELQDAHLLFSDGARKIFALLLKVQNMAESEVGSIVGELSAVVNDAGQAQAAATTYQQTPYRTPHPNDGVLKDGHTTQPSVFISQMNSQETIDAGKSMRLASALDSAKSIFKDALRASGLPDDIADKVDNVSLEDINKLRNKNGQVPFGEAQSPALNAEPQLSQETPGNAVTAPLMPTEEVKADEKDVLFGCFIGPHSVFAQYLSGDAMFSARGELKVGFHPEGEQIPIKRYSQDARWIDEPNLRHWPTGFYTDRDSKMMQLLVNTDQAAFLVGSLPSEVSPVDIFVYGSKQGYRSVQSFEASELHLLHAKLVDALAALAKKK